MSTKSIKQLNHYGDHFLRLLTDTHYCIRRNLYHTNVTLFLQANYQRPFMLYSYGDAVRVDKETCTPKHYINN